MFIEWYYNKFNWIDFIFQHGLQTEIKNEINTLFGKDLDTIVV